MLSTYNTVESYQKELTHIKKILKNNPKGMTVTDISREISINRNSVAKYLDVLLISGHADMISFGPAKVFFPSKRVPISSVLDYISDYIIILDESLRVQQVNEMFLDFFNLNRDNCIGNKINKNIFPLIEKTNLLTYIQDAIDGKEFQNEIQLNKERVVLYFRVRLLPTTFDDGQQGVTCIISNITDRRRIENVLKGNASAFNEEEK